MQLIHENVQKSIRTTLPRNDAIVSGGVLIQFVIPVNSGAAGPAFATALTCCVPGVAVLRPCSASNSDFTASTRSIDWSVLVHSGASVFVAQTVNVTSRLKA